VPGREPDRDAQRAARPFRFHLDRAQAVQHAPADRLSAGPVGARQGDQELAVAEPADPVEAAKFPPQRSTHVAERLRRQLAAMLTLYLLEPVDPHEQAAQLRLVAPGAVDLLVEPFLQRRERQARHLPR